MSAGWSPDQCPKWCETEKCRYQETGVHVGPTLQVTEQGHGHACVRLAHVRGERGTWVQMQAHAGTRHTANLRPATAAEHAEHLVRLLVTIAPEMVPPLMDNIAKMLAEEGEPWSRCY